MRPNPQASTVGSPDGTILSVFANVLSPDVLRSCPLMQRKYLMKMKLILNDQAPFGE
jgi:hypothetical protein